MATVAHMMASTDEDGEKWKSFVESSSSPTIPNLPTRPQKIDSGDELNMEGSVRSQRTANILSPSTSRGGVSSLQNDLDKIMNYGRSLSFDGECNWFDNNDNKDSFCDEKKVALNDALPKTPIARSFSDSELSEASTINSGYDIKARREAVRNRRKEIQKQRQQKHHDAAISEVEEAFNNTSEDDELVDTAKDLPGIVNEMALRRKKWREDRKARENNDSLRRSSHHKSSRRQSGSSERRRKSSITSTRRSTRRSSTNESLSPRSPRLATSFPRKTPRRGKKKDFVNDSSLEPSAGLLSDQPEHYTSEDLWSTKRRSSSRSNNRRARQLRLSSHTQGSASSERPSTSSNNGFESLLHRARGESKSNELRLSSHTQGSASSESVWSPSASSKNGFERLLQHSKKEMPLHHPRKIRSMVETINCPIITGSQSPNKVETPALLPRKTQSLVETTKPQRRVSSKGQHFSRLSEEVADSAAGVLLDNAKSNELRLSSHTQGSASSESVWNPSASSKNGFERLLQHSKKEMPLHHPRKIRSMVETINCPIITGSQSPNKVETPALLPRKPQSLVETTKPQRRVSSKGQHSSRLSEEVADSAAGVFLDNAKDGSTTKEAHEITRTPLERTDNSFYDLKKRTFLIKSKSARYLTNIEAKQDASVPKSSSAAGSLSAFTQKYDQTVTNTKDMKNHSFFVKSKSAPCLSFSESSLSTRVKISLSICKTI